MVDKRKKQPVRKKQSVTDKNASNVYINRFYIMWAVVLLCFVTLICRAFYVQIINKDFFFFFSNDNILRTNTIKAMHGVVFARYGFL